MLILKQQKSHSTPKVYVLYKIKRINNMVCLRIRGQIYLFRMLIAISYCRIIHYTVLPLATSSFWFFHQSVYTVFIYLFTVFDCVPLSPPFFSSHRMSVSSLIHSFRYYCSQLSSISLCLTLIRIYFIPHPFQRYQIVCHLCIESTFAN